MFPAHKVCVTLRSPFFILTFAQFSDVTCGESKRSPPTFLVHLEFELLLASLKHWRIRVLEGGWGVRFKRGSRLFLVFQRCYKNLLFIAGSGPEPAFLSHRSAGLFPKAVFFPASRSPEPSRSRRPLSVFAASQ